MKIALAVLVAIVIALLLFRPKGDIDSDAAHALVKEGATLLDVRSPGEFASGHVTGAINIPVDRIASRLAEVPKDKAVVLYCQSGARSARAASILRDAGYDRVHNVGAMPSW